jgi:hypothetical protein
VNYRAMRYAIEQAAVEGPAWKVLAVIAYHADRTTGFCSASRRRLAKEARTSTSAVHRSLEELIKGGHLAIVVAGSGRRATTYQVLVPDPASGSIAELLEREPNESVMEPLAPVDKPDRSGSNGSTGEPLSPVDNSGRQPVVAPSPIRSGSMVTPVYKEGREELRRVDLLWPPSGSNADAGSDAPPDGVAAGYEVPSTTDPTSVVGDAVLAVDPDALRDPDGWNLSDRFGRAWLPNEDVAAWLRRYRKAASA